MKHRIKVVQVIADSGLGGGPKHVLEILKHLDHKRFEAFLICPSGDLSASAKEINGVTVYNVPFKSKFDLGSAWKVFNDLHQIQSSSHPFAPMIAHYHGARAGFVGRIFRPKHIFTIYTEHSFDFNFHLANPVNEWVQRSLLARYNQGANLVIAVSSSVRDYLLANKLAPKGRTVVIPNGIDCREFDRFPGKQRINEANKAPIIGSVGSLNRQKGYEYLISAMPRILHKYPLATLEIVGDGPEFEELARQVRRMKLNHHVTFLGAKREIFPVMKHWDIFVLPSISETFGIVILEAMEAGLPVVATNVGGIKDIVDNGRNGLLVPAAKPEALANKITEVLDRPVLAAKLRQAGKKRVKDFDWDKVIIGLENAYKEVVSTHN